MRVAYIPRSVFLDSHWDYRAGEHLTMLGRTGMGKTTLMYQLMQRTAHPGMPSVTLVMKPRDPTVVKWDRRLNAQKVKGWPPPWNPFRENPSHWTLWPDHTLRDVEATNQNMQTQFREAIYDSYGTEQKRILFADELYGLTAELKMEKELVMLWTRGRSMECGLWGSSQKPAWIPTWAYSQATHLFLHKDPDKRVEQRYAEIGGVDPDIVKLVTRKLKPFQYLYIDRRGPYMCVVEPE